MKLKTKTSGHINMSNLEVTSAEESTNLEKKVIDDGLQVTDGEKAEDTENQVNKFYEINESLIFGDVPENENSLKTLIELSSKNDEDKNLVEDSFDEANSPSNLQNLAVYLSSRRYSKLPKISSEILENASVIESTNNNSNEELSKLQTASNDEISNNTHTESSDSIKNNKGSRIYSELPNLSNDEVPKNADILHTDIKNSNKGSKRYSELSNKMNEIGCMQPSNNIKNSKGNKRFSEVPNVSNDEVSKNTDTLHTDIIKNSKRECKRYSELSNKTNEIGSTSTEHSETENNRNGRKIQPKLSNVSKKSVKNINTITINNKKGKVEEHSISAFPQNITNVAASLKEKGSTSGITENKNFQSVKAKYENINTSKTRVFLVRFPVSPQALKLNKESIDSKLTQIVKTVSKSESPSAAASTSFTLQKEMPLKPDIKKLSSNEVKKKIFGNISSDSKDEAETNLKIAEAMKGLMQPRVSLADFLDNREVFKSQLKDEDLSFVNKIYSSPELNKCLQINSDNFGKFNEITDDLISSDETKIPLKRSIRLKNVAKTKKSFKGTPDLMDDKVFKISDLVKSSEISVTRLEKDCEQNVVNTIANDNLHVSKYLENEKAKSSDTFQRNRDQLINADISRCEPLVFNHSISKIDAFEEPPLSKDMKKCAQERKSFISNISSKQTLDVSRLSASFNEIANKCEKGETFTSDSGRKQPSLMDMFKRYSEKIDSTSEPEKFPTEQNVHQNTISESHVTKPSENAKQASKALSPRNRTGFNDNKSMSSDLLPSGSFQSNKHANSVCLNSAANEGYQETGKPVAKSTVKSRSSSRKRSIKLPFDPSSSPNDDMYSFSKKSHKKEKKCTVKDSSDFQSPAKVQERHKSHLLPFDSVNDSVNSTLCSTESSNIQARNSKKKPRNTIINILSRMQTRTSSSFPNSDVKSISPQKVSPKKSKNLEIELVRNGCESSPRKRCQSRKTVSQTLYDENEIVTSKTDKKAHSKKKIACDSFTESTVPVKRRKRSSSVDSKLFHLQDPETVSSEAGNLASKRREKYSNKHKISQSVSDFSADSDAITSKTDICSESVLKTKRRRSVSFEPKSYSYQTLLNEVSEPSAESEKEYSPKNKRLRRCSSAENTSGLNSFTDNDLRENVESEEYRSRCSDELSKNKIQQACSKNAHAPNSNSVSPELCNTINAQHDEDTSNSESNVFDTQVQNNYGHSEATPSNDQNRSQYLQIPGQPTNIPVLNPVNNSLVFGNPVIQVPQLLNRNVLYPYSYNMQNPFCNPPSFNSFSAPPNIYTFPVFQSRPLLQPSNLQLNNSSNANSPYPPGTAEASTAINSQNVSSLNSTVLKKLRPKFIINNTSTITSHTVKNMATPANPVSSVIKNFDKERENIVQEIRKKCFPGIHQFSQSFFAQNVSLSKLSFRHFFSNPLVLNTLQEKVHEEVPHFVDSKVDFVFPPSFFDSPVREIVKNYVEFYLEDLCKTTVTTEYSVKRAFKKFPIRDCIYLSEAFPKVNEELNQKDLVCYLSCAALLAALDTSKKRKLI